MTKAWRKPSPSPPRWYWWDSDNCWGCKNRNNCNNCSVMKELRDFKRKKRKQKEKTKLKQKDFSQWE